MSTLRDQVQRSVNHRLDTEPTLEVVKNLSETIAGQKCTILELQRALTDEKVRVAASRMVQALHRLGSTLFRWRNPVLQGCVRRWGQKLHLSTELKANWLPRGAVEKMMEPPCARCECLPIHMEPGLLIQALQEVQQVLGEGA